MALAERKQNNGMIEVASSRQAQEVQAAMVIAQKFPRDVNRAFARVMEDCKRKTLAEKAVYRYPRGKDSNGDSQIVTGPSIRLAEAIAKAYGNLDFGIIELEKKSGIGGLPGESTLMSYCWDLETNTRSTKVFTVSHKRNTKKASYNLTDERDIYELTANNGARRLRACILSVIPSDIVDAAVEACRTTIKQGSGGPLIDRVRKMVIAFKDIGVSSEMLEKYLGHSIDLITEDDVVDLLSVFTSIKDGMADRKDFFEFTNVVENNTVPENEIKSIKPKNFAPQTPDEAQKINKELASKTQETDKVNSEVGSETFSRADLIKMLLGFQSKLKVSNKDFNDEIFNLTGKKNNELSTSEIKELCAIFEARFHKQKEGNKND